MDFRSKVTRVDFEEMCSDLFDRVQKPVQHALEAADMTMVCVYTSLDGVIAITIYMKQKNFSFLFTGRN